MADQTEFIKLRVIQSVSMDEIHFRVKKTTFLGKMKMTYSVRIGVPVAAVSFYYEGTRISDDETPRMLNMEDDDVIDAYLQEDWRTRRQEELEEERLRREMAFQVCEGLEAILETKTMTDFKILCKDQSFECHKLILCARSPYFKGMFGSDMKENQEGQMEIRDMEPETVKTMIKFIYSGKVENLRFQGDQRPFGTQAIELLQAGDRFDLSGLKHLCEQFLISHLTINNVLDMLILADTHNALRLKKAAKRMVIEKGPDIVERTQWKEKLISNPAVFCELFDAAMKESKTCVCLRSTGSGVGRRSPSYTPPTWRSRSNSPNDNYRSRR
jgi:hypothetical protein